MIAHLSGTLFDKRDGCAIIDVGGVGYAAQISQQSLFALPPVGSPVNLRTYLHVREDALQLIGFTTESEETLFGLLISVSGVGPKLALTILSGMPAAELAGAVSGGDLARLTRISGVGKKTAERLVVELKDKIQKSGLALGATKTAAPVNDELVSGLINLGYKPAEAERVAAQARSALPSAPLQELIREALRSVGR